MDTPTGIQDILSQILANQMKLMASVQATSLLQCRIAASVSGLPLKDMLDQQEELYRQELNRLQLVGLAELKGLQSGKTPETGGPPGGAG